MWDIAICDDEQSVQRELVALWEKHFAKEKYRLFCFSNGNDLLESAKNIIFDCIYLDIRMPQLDGIETAKKLRDLGSLAPIIFLTNYDDYLEIGYEVQAFRYRFKPIQEDLFLRDFAAWKNLLQSQKKILIKTANGSHIIPLNDIIYLEIVNRKVKIVSSSDTFFSTQPMQHWEATLPSNQFLFPYNKIMVNLNHVIFFDQTKVLTTGGYQLPMSRRKYAYFKTAMLNCNYM